MEFLHIRHVPRFPKFPELEETDWHYTMRREMQEILPGLFLGPYAAAGKSKLEYLQSHGVTHIVCVRQSNEAHFIHPNFPAAFSYLVLEVEDSFTENIVRFIPQVHSFIDNCLQCNGKVLVHGNAGISRSAALVTGYIMEKYGLSYNQAFYHVRDRRYCVNLNENFIHQLMEHEYTYSARMRLEKETLSSGEQKRKRAADEEENKLGGNSMT